MSTIENNKDIFFKKMFHISVYKGNPSDQKF